MFGTQHLLVFIVTGLVLNATPGPDTLYILGRTLSQGKRAGLASVLGIGTGSIIHTLAAAFGLSTLLATSSMAFQVVKSLGALYLIYLGIRMLFSKATQPKEGIELKTEPEGRIYLQAIITNLLNPKVALFFLALLPQFVRPDEPNKTGAFIFLGTVFVVNGTIYCMLLVLLASRVANTIKRHSGFEKWAGKITGLIFVGLGLRVAMNNNR